MCTHTCTSYVCTCSRRPANPPATGALPPSPRPIASTCGRSWRCPSTARSGGSLPSPAAPRARGTFGRTLRCCSPTASRSCMSCHAVSCRVMPCHAVSCRVMVRRELFRVSFGSCHAMSCRVMPCHDPSRVGSGFVWLAWDRLQGIYSKGREGGGSAQAGYQRPHKHQLRNTSTFTTDNRTRPRAVKTASEPISSHPTTTTSNRNNSNY